MLSVGPGLFQNSNGYSVVPATGWWKFVKLGPLEKAVKRPFQLISKECCTKAATLSHQCISRKPSAEIEMTHSYCR